MRKIFVLALTCSFLQLTLPGTAQQKNNTARPTLQRCGSDEYLDLLIRRDPTLKARLQALEERVNQVTLDKINARRANKNAGTRLEAVVTIPVVVHIVLPNPTIVTDADVQWQINKMNEDFGGHNADSVNAGSFASLFGHSNIQFCLAQQDVKGNPSTGIERVSSTITFTRLTPEKLKKAATCGANSWDADRYFNIWVGESTDGTLGVATFPTSAPADEQGIVVAVDGFSNNPAYVSSNFNLGRTAVHETGHFFFARHIWGDGSCASDFPSVAGLPAFVDDTPSQSGQTTGCPSGVMASGCTDAPTPPGRMYQNYMDYTDDACYCMFTLNQVARMEAALDVFRASLKTSAVCTPAASVTNDAALSAILTPALGGNCNSTASNTFCNTDIVPRVTIKNYGTATLTSVNIQAQVDNGTPITTVWAGSLSQFSSVTLDLLPITAAEGAHDLKIYVTDPNTVIDGRTANDTLNTTFSILTSIPVTEPLQEGFESAVFPPGDWKLINENAASLTWERTTLASKSGSASATMQFFDYTTKGEKDYLLSPVIDVTSADSVILNFERAYKIFDAASGFADSLAVVVSTDCGNTFKEAWKRGGSGLATVSGTLTTTGYVPSAGDWANTRLNLKTLIGSATQVIIGFKAVNSFGQNLYLDDVNIEVFRFKSNDAAITAINDPSPRLCERTFTPNVRLENKGGDTLKNVKIVFLVDNIRVDSVNWTGSLKTNASANVSGSKPLTIPAGNEHLLTVYLSNPNGMPDDNNFGDTARRELFIHDVHDAPVTEGFESTAFPSVDWDLVPSGSAYTWERNTKASTEGTASMWIRNYRFSSNGKSDLLISPPVQTGSFDSSYVQFDLAHVTKPPAGVGTTFDTLEVLLSVNCGLTFVTVYKKWGLDLQTVTNPPTFSDTLGFVPANKSQWRTEKINVTANVPKNGQFMVAFKNTSNNGNNTFIDAINLYTVTLPARLKSNGYLVLPNPFNTSFIVRHVQPPADLKAIEVFNATGQLVYRKVFNKNATTYEVINLARYSNGVYAVKLVYDKKVITERIIKL